MPTFSKKTVQRVLEKKGFKRDKKRSNHLIYFLYDQDNKRTAIRTMLSHNDDDIRDTLFSKIAKELHLNNQQAAEYFDCSLSREGYYEILKNNGSI